VLGVVSLGRDDDPPLLEDTSAMEKVYQNWPPLEFGPAAVTDRGTTIRLEIASASREPARLGPLERQLLDGLGRTTRLIRSQPADDHSNCHGWVFTGGRYWLEVEEAETILRENGYQHVSVPSPGDLVVYRNAQGDPGHTAVVRAVCDDGAVLVEGKWSWMGVYLHRVGDSIFGPHYTFLRSPRPGHLLAGLPAATSP
jgi:hypothetical protein